MVRVLLDGWRCGRSLPLLSFRFGLFNTASSFSLAFNDALPILSDLVETVLVVYFLRSL